MRNIPYKVLFNSAPADEMIQFANLMLLQTRQLNHDILKFNVLALKAPPSENISQQLRSRYQLFYVYIKIAAATLNIDKIQSNKQP